MVLIKERLKICKIWLFEVCSPADVLCCPRLNPIYIWLLVYLGIESALYSGTRELNASSGHSEDQVSLDVPAQCWTVSVPPFLLDMVLSYVKMYSTYFLISCVFADQPFCWCRCYTSGNHCTVTRLAVVAFSHSVMDFHSIWKGLLGTVAQFRNYLTVVDW